MGTKEIFSNKLKMLRLRKGITQEQLAEYLGYCPKSMTKFERTKTTLSFEVLDKLSETFNVQPTYFLNPVDINFSNEYEEKRKLLHEKIEELDDSSLDLLFKFIFSL